MSCKDCVLGFQCDLLSHHCIPSILQCRGAGVSDSWSEVREHPLSISPWRLVLSCQESFTLQKSSNYTWGIMPLWLRLSGGAVAVRRRVEFRRFTVWVRVVMLVKALERGFVEGLWMWTQATSQISMIHTFIHVRMTFTKHLNKKNAPS